MIMKACSVNSKAICGSLENWNGDIIKKQKMTVLIVDDSSLIIQKIIELLQDVASILEFKSCGTHHEAIQLMNELLPAVAILDINLPDKSGIDVLMYIKQNHPKTIVIMCTNQVSSYYKEQCLKLGANFFIDKSKDFEKIPQLISSIYN
ncbi:MAG: response regulator transcription factor [Segetibacter sp.]|nr:response regulator transcription factor [Segetibacter sp.]